MPIVNSLFSCTVCSLTCFTKQLWAECEKVCNHFGTKRPSLAYPKECRHQAVYQHVGGPYIHLKTGKFSTNSLKIWWAFFWVLFPNFACSSATDGISKTLWNWIGTNYAWCYILLTYPSKVVEENFLRYVSLSYLGNLRNRGCSAAYFVQCLNHMHVLARNQCGLMGVDEWCINWEFEPRVIVVEF